MDNKIVETEKYYNILVNEENEIMIAIRERESEPEDPELIYAGGKHALLCRTPQVTVILDFINPQVRKLLHKAREVLVVELRDGELVREYMAPAKQVRRLPISRKELP